MTQKIPTLSIIIPHFNSVDSLELLLNSIGYHEDVETIIVDDKSTQNLSQLEKLKKKYNSFIFLPNTTPNKGAGVSRNVGLQHARGTWLLFADADDIFAEGWYKIVSQQFGSTADIVFFPPSGCGERQVPYANLVNSYLENKVGAERQLRYQFFPPWSKLVKRMLVNQNRIVFGTSRFSNDVLFSIKIGYYASHITAVNQPIYCLLERPGSLTKNNSFDAFYKRQEVICEAYSFLRSHLSDEEFKKNSIRRAPLAFVLRALKNKFSLKEIFTLCKLYRKNRIPLFACDMLDIRKILKRVFNVKK